MRKPPVNEGSFRTIATITAVPLLGFLVLSIYALVRPYLPEQDGAPASAGVKKHRLKPVHSPRPTGNIVLILDDVGFDGQPLERAMSLDPNVNFAILPNGSRTSHYASLLNERGFEILCHLPMEPEGEAAPGPNAVLTSMSNAEIARITRANLRAVPYARGVNNHMGSRATTDRRVMASVFSAMPDDMYFIDSRTGERSVAATVAREMNVRTASRHIFLDNVRDADAIRLQIRRAAQTARAERTAVAIGHLYPETIEALAGEIPELKRS